MTVFDPAPAQGPGQDPQGPPEQPRYRFRMVSGDQHTEVEGTRMVSRGRQMIAVYDGDDCVGLAAGNCAVVRQAIPEEDGG